MIRNSTCERNLGKGEVCGLGGGVPLDADDAEAQVGLLDHADVVAAVADGRSEIRLVRLLHHPHQLALLYWGESANDTEEGKFHKMA